MIGTIDGLNLEKNNGDAIQKKRMVKSFKKHHTHTYNHKLYGVKAAHTPIHRLEVIRCRKNEKMRPTQRRPS